MNRNELIDYLKTCLTVHSDGLALWLEGADAAARVDAYSDIDLWLAARDGQESAIMTFV